MLRKILISLVLLGPVTLAGCSALSFTDRFTKTHTERKQDAEDKKLAAIAARPEVEPDRVLNAGVRSLNDGSTKKALKAFDEINKQSPFSAEAQRSLVLSAYTHFRTKEYDKTISKSEQFLQLYPGSSDAAYMQYLIGESYFQQVGAVVLDQSDANKGLQAYGDLVRLYPDSKYAEDAKKKMLFLSDQLAGKEMQIGRYYQERRQHLAAINRFKFVVENHQMTNHVEEALYRLTESYLALGLVNDARSNAALLGYNYPDSPWHRDAFKLLTGKKVNEPVQAAASEKVESPAKEGGGLSRFVPFQGKKKDI